MYGVEDQACTYVAKLTMDLLAAAGCMMSI